MRFALLGSGSEGNALVVQAGVTRVLMDCGFGLSETVMRLARLGLSPEDIDGIIVTHEHGDHIGGVARLARRCDIPVWLTHGTRLAHDAAFNGVTRLTEISPQHAFAIGDLRIQPYAVPHDAAEPVQYTFGDGARRLGVLTDTGCITPHIEATLNGCDALVLECNHDAAMLAAGDYPWSLKQRVGGRFGHLNNQEAAALLECLDCSRLQHIIAAHLSRKNNTPELAVAALSAALNCEASWVTVATQEEGVGWREIV
ncbi:MAG: MBL fold metallo-hydrolase [Gallionellaceae bacterium]|jgi:phosphoribosyl 1,2-cyclic phosphodiesterase|nr:MBL fold metallo-hydrolase [Gallionellaceae bacterium]